MSVLENGRLARYLNWAGELFRRVGPFSTQEVSGAEYEAIYRILRIQPNGLSGFQDVRSPAPEYADGYRPDRQDFPYVLRRYYTPIIPLYIAASGQFMNNINSFNGSGQDLTVGVGEDGTIEVCMFQGKIGSITISGGGISFGDGRNVAEVDPVGQFSDVSWTRKPQFGIILPEICGLAPAQEYIDDQPHTIFKRVFAINVME